MDDWKNRRKQKQKEKNLPQVNEQENVVVQPIVYESSNRQVFKRYLNLKEKN